MKKNHSELVVAYEMERRLERDIHDTLGMDAVDDLLQAFDKEKKNLNKKPGSFKSQQKRKKSCDEMGFLLK